MLLAAGQQHTIKKTGSIAGKGIHSGKFCQLTIRPGEEDSGIVFQRMDLPGRPAVKAHPENLDSASRATSLTVPAENQPDVREGSGGFKVETIEHLMACLAARGIDNLRVELASSELPSRDGSARIFTELLQDCGIRPQARPRLFLVPRRPLVFSQESSYLLVLPPESYQDPEPGKADRVEGTTGGAGWSEGSEGPGGTGRLGGLRGSEGPGGTGGLGGLRGSEGPGGTGGLGGSGRLGGAGGEIKEAQLRLEYQLDYGDSPPGYQQFSYAINQLAARQEDFSSFSNDLAAARTFALKYEFAALRERGLARGGTAREALLFADDGPNQSLRYANEPARHKLLDLLGDLYLAGPLLARVLAVRTGHRHNHRVVKLLQALQEKESGGEGAKK